MLPPRPGFAPVPGPRPCGPPRRHPALPPVRPLLALALAACALAPAASAQPGLPTTVSWGVGAVGPGTDLGPGFSVGVRHRLLTVDPDELPAPVAALFQAGHAWTVAADGFAQRGFEHSGGRWFAGGGALLRWDPVSDRPPVRPYVVLASVGAYAGVERAGRPPSLGLGVGYGFGLEVPVGGRAVSLELRGVGVVAGEGGSLPVTFGFSF